VAPEPILYSIRKQLATISPDQQTYGIIADLEMWIRNELEWARGRLIRPNSRMVGKQEVTRYFRFAR
jgi:hypothetical protein